MPRSFEPVTNPPRLTATLIFLLSVTGMRIGEAIRRDVEDFDPDIGMVVIRDTKFGKTREVPLHQTTATALSSYLGRENQPNRSAGTRALFLSTVGTRLLYNRMQQAFRELVVAAGLKRRSSSCRPRLHDLRHTFAVETILDGYRDGNEPGNRIALRCESSPSPGQRVSPATRAMSVIRLYWYVVVRGHSKMLHQPASYRSAEHCMAIGRGRHRLKPLQTPINLALILDTDEGSTFFVVTILDFWI